MEVAATRLLQRIVAFLWGAREMLRRAAQSVVAMIEMALFLLAVYAAA